MCNYLQEAYFANKCNKEFKDPDAGVQAEVDNEDFTIPRPPKSANGIPAPRCAGKTPGGPALPFPQPEAEDAIMKLCSDRKYWNQVLVPLLSFGTPDQRRKTQGSRPVGKVLGRWR